MVQTEQTKQKRMTIWDCDVLKTLVIINDQSIYFIICKNGPSILYPLFKLFHNTDTTNYIYDLDTSIFSKISSAK